MSEDSLTLARIVESQAGPLRSVEIHSAVESPTAEDLLSEADLTALRLAFANSVLWILCLGATDEVSLLLKPPSWAPASVVSVATTPPWDGCLGLELQSASFLTNNRGYTDAIQIHFASANSSVQTRVQVEALASRFWFWRLAGPFIP